MASALNADFSVVAFSGYGVVSGYCDGVTGEPTKTLPQYYTKLGYCQNPIETFNPSTTAWNFSRQPDVIVINLGTNDASYCQDISQRHKEFEIGYVSLLKTIRHFNPKATVICSLGIKQLLHSPDIEKAMKAYCAETGDANIHYFQFDPQLYEEGFAVHWHPTERTYERASRKLVQKINNMLSRN